MVAVSALDAIVKEHSKWANDIEKKKRPWSEFMSGKVTKIYVTY